MYACGIFIDLQKAFDTVNHSILLQKLQHYGIRGIINDWFSSYLLNRIQTTQIGTVVSDKETVLSGVPQGSVLGPLLFLIYINDIHNSTDKLKFSLFADDTNLLYADNDLRSLETTVNHELIKLYNWLTANKLSLNVKKSNFVIFHSHQKRLDYQVDLKIFDNHSNTFSSLEHKNYVKYLGVLIDSGLTWKDHIDHVASNISKSIGIIAKLRHFVPRSTTSDIYRSLILPYTSYGIILWGQAARVYLNKIFKLQKRALRLMNFGKYTSHAISFLFLIKYYLSICFISVSMLMHDVYNNMTPLNISNLFISAREVNFYVKNSRLDKLHRSFSRTGVWIWNSISDDLYNSSKKKFKRKLHEIFSILIEEEDYVDLALQ